MFEQLKKINNKPEPFGIYSVDTLWTTPHIAEKMLQLHINPDHDAASRSGDFIKKSVSFMDKSFNLNQGKSVIDFGCGPGLYTSAFASLGAKVTGIDFSVNSLEYAKKQAALNHLDINYQQIDYLNFTTDTTYDVATLIYCDFCAINKSNRRKLLQTIKNCLKDDGYFFFDVHTQYMFEHRSESARYEYHKDGAFFSPHPHFEFVNDFLYPDELISLAHYTIIEENSTWDVYNWLQYFSLDDLKKELNENGFKIVGKYKNLKGDPFTEKSNDMAILCQKLDV